jgi:nitrite reductase (NO-forming)
MKTAHFSARSILALALGGVLVASLPARAQEPAGEARAANKLLAADLPLEVAVLTHAPQVPPPIGRRHAAKVLVNLEVKEVTQRLADGVDYTFWTFGGEVPGMFIRVREGDVVEFHLNNHPSSKVPHNIDLHAVTGPGGGAASTFTAPGHSSQFTFTALRAGLYVYHCATAPVPMHIANGMYGMILVEPKEGLAPVDREFYVMQGDIYTQGKNGEAGVQAFDNEKAIDERPTYVVFNGAVGSLVGDKALKAKVGETVRIFFGVGGPNLTSSFHIIGEIFDRVYPEGGMKYVQENVQTTLVPTGGSAILEFHLEEPGTFVLVDHSLTRAFNKGAIGMLNVTGTGSLVTYSGKQADEIYTGEHAAAFAANQPARAAEVTAAAKSSATTAVVASAGPVTKEIQLERGKKIFMTACFACHMANGEGLPGVFPPLARSDFLQANRSRAIRIPIKGLTGPVTVNGKTYNNVMPPQPFDDEQLADVLTYVMNSWGNDLGVVTPQEVRHARGENAEVARSDE